MPEPLPNFGGFNHGLLCAPALKWSVNQRFLMQKPWNLPLHTSGTLRMQYKTEVGMKADDHQSVYVELASTSSFGKMDVDCK